MFYPCFCFVEGVCWRRDENNYEWSKSKIFFLHEIKNQIKSIISEWVSSVWFTSMTYEKSFNCANKGSINSIFWKRDSSESPGKKKRFIIWGFEKTQIKIYISKNFAFMKIKSVSEETDFFNILSHFVWAKKFHWQTFLQNYLFKNPPFYSYHFWERYYDWMQT